MEMNLRLKFVKHRKNTFVTLEIVKGVFSHFKNRCFKKLVTLKEKKNRTSKLNVHLIKIHISKNINRQKQIGYKFP